MNDNNPQNKSTSEVAKSLALLIHSTINTFICIFAMVHLWAWFVVPLGVPAINALHAWGLIILAGFVSMQGGGHDPQTEVERHAGYEKSMKRLSSRFASYLIFWLLGYIAHLFMVM